MLVFLMARATRAFATPAQADAGLADPCHRQRRLAEITEMIHVASLVHDDVLDECDVRRGSETVNSLYGTRVAVLVGDFLFAQSSWGLAQLDDLEVIRLISQVIADFADGEITQAQSLFDVDATLDAYLDKSFYKTASLIAASCRSAAVFSVDEAGIGGTVTAGEVDQASASGTSLPALQGCSPAGVVPLERAEEVKAAAFEYGKRLGLAFQVVDDLLDLEVDAEGLGKPAGQDLASGNLTAPALLALEAEAAREAALGRDPLGGELRSLIESEFAEGDDDVRRAVDLVRSLGGVDAARQLAREEGERASRALDVLPDSEAKRSLLLMVDWVLLRLN